MSKVKGLIKSIIGTDAIVAVDANGNQRILKAGDVIYDNVVIMTFHQLSKVRLSHSLI